MNVQHLAFTASAEEIHAVLDHDAVVIVDDVRDPIEAIRGAPAR